MKILINKDLKIRLLKALSDGVYDTTQFPEFATDGQREFLNLMKEATAEDNTKIKEDGNDTIK